MTLSRSRRLVLALPLAALFALPACDSATRDDVAGTLSPAFAEFSDNVTVMLDGDEVVIESNGLPDHTSPYWSPESPLYEADPDVRLVPGFIDNFQGSYTLTVSANPTVSSGSSATGLGPIGIARSGAMIYNDQEGPGRPIDEALPGLDRSGAHTGPQSYHYHLEPTAWSQDDDNLIGIMADGFFLYGRRDATGEYPTDLDASGGHTGATPHNADGEYHYHIQNDVYLGQYYLLFPGDYQGTPSSIR